MAAVLHEWRIGEPVKVSEPSVDSYADIVQLYTTRSWFTIEQSMAKQRKNQS